ncbi:MAG: DUF4962 domain-containing protein [Nitrospiraceae bacterium]|nr:DUF4962 domain-containing protein [Nitrospiraceae bacterium]
MQRSVIASSAWMLCLLLAVVVGRSLPAGAIELDERPARVGEWGYRPDGTEVGLNPPGFTWRPAKGASSYTLQVARDRAFMDIAYVRDDLLWSAHCPSTPLPEGALYWRYAAVGKNGRQSPWSQTRTFSIAADAVTFPLPTREELAARMPKEHPRLFFRPEDVAEFRELASGPLAVQAADVIKQADRLLASPPDTTEPPKYPKEVTRKKTPDKWRRIWWGNRGRVIAVADGAATLGFAYRLTGDERYGKAARDLLVAMTAWDTEGSTNYRYNDEAAMPALYMPSRAYSWAYPLLSAKDRAAIVKMMRKRGRQCYLHLTHRNHLWQPFASHSNRAWHFLGEVAIAFYDEIPEAPEWLDYAMTILYTAYPVWGDSDGGWHEGTAYWSSYIGRFMYWAYAIDAAFDIDVFERPFFRRLGYYGMYLLPPGSKTGGFGDQAILAKSSSIARLLAVLASGAQNAHWKWYADTCGANVGGGYLGFIYAANAVGLEGAPPTDLPTSTCFKGVGIAVLNSNLMDASNNVQIHFKSSPMGRQSHGYNANNAFLLTLGGQRAFIRSGKRDLHGSPHHRKWMWETKSDNAILVNGVGQVPHVSSATGEIVHFATSDTVDVVVGEAAASYENLDRWTRRIVFFKPYAILIHDLLEAKEPSTFEWLLHAINTPFEIDGQRLEWNGTPGKISVEFLEPQGLKIDQTDKHDVPMADWAKVKWDEWHLCAQAAEKVKQREFLTLLVVNDAAVEAAHKTKGDTTEVVLTLPDGEATVRLGRKTFAVRAPGFDRTF